MLAGLHAAHPPLLRRLGAADGGVRAPLLPRRLRFNGISIEAFHEAPFHAECREAFPQATHHYCWWSVPLELLEDCP